MDNKLDIVAIGESLIELSTNANLASSGCLYKYYGGGNKEDGKKTLRQLYVVNQAISYVVEKANITVEPDTQTTESSEN